MHTLTLDILRQMILSFIKTKHYEFKSILHSLLTSCKGRDFMESGYDEYSGMLDTMCIFAYGDTLRFMESFQGSIRNSWIDLTIV